MASKKNTRKRSIAETRRANNERGAPSGSEYPLDKFGGGKVSDRGVKSAAPKGYRPAGGLG